MITFIKRAAAMAVSAIALVCITARASHAGAADYEFQLVKQEVKVGKGAEIAVRLVHKPDGKPVADAVIYQTRLDMGPDSMEEMTAPVTVAPSSEPGVYRFKANVSMAGGWALSLAAKVQGETETVQGKLLLKAQP